jgi:hypothetical protein
MSSRSQTVENPNLSEIVSRDTSWLLESLAGDAEGRNAARVNIPETLIFRV